MIDNMGMYQGYTVEGSAKLKFEPEEKMEHASYSPCHPVMECPEERRNPDIIKATRKQRIAAGCGLKVEDVNRLLKQFDEMKVMMKQMKNMKF